MKRIIAQLLLCCLLLAVAAPAGAETAPLRYAAIAQELLDDWLEERYPDISLEVGFGPDSTQEAIQMLESADAPDLMMVQSSRVDIYALLQSGLLEDLSGHEEIQLGLAQMYQPFRDLVTSADGAVYGVPYAMQNRTMHALPQAWEAAGLNVEDAPESFEALLAFVQRWTALVAEGAAGDVRLYASGEYLMDERRYTLWLTDLLVRCWAIRQQAAGEAVSFDDPAFVALADRARDAGRALAAAEEKPGAASLSLYDAGLNAGVGYGDDALDDYAFPMRLNADEPFRVHGSCWLFVVRKGSDYAQVCMDFLGNLIHRTDPVEQRNVKLYTDIPEQQFTGPEGEAGYVLTPAWVESYRPERLFFLCDPFHTTAAYTSWEDLTLRFADYEITAQELASGLEQALTEE